MKLSEIDKQDIVKLSEIHKQSEIAIMYSISQTTVFKILKDNNIKRKRNRLNLSRLAIDFNYFDNIDCGTKAYWLGFISADGCLKGGKLRVTSKDLDILEKLKSDLKSDHAITINKSIHKKTKKEYVSYILQITNSAFTNKLTKFIPQDKSNNFNIPAIKKELYPYFIAGMVDGDGSFSVNSKGQIKASIISTKECLQQIQDYLFVNLSIKKTTLQNITKNGNVWKLFVYSSSKEFLEFIYSDSNKNIYLKRKQEKLKNMFINT
jgi:hypothetical protein